MAATIAAPDLLIADVMRSVTSGAEPERAATRLLDALTRDGSSSAATLYLLDLMEARYSIFAHAGRGPGARSLPFEAVSVSRTDLETNRVAPIPLPDSPGLCRLPIVRNKSAIGVLDFTATDATAEFDTSSLGLLSTVGVSIYEHRFASRLIGGIQRPIPYDRAEERFLADILEVVRESSGMPYIAVREVAGPDVLRCLAAHGFDDVPSGVNRDDLTLTDIHDRAPAFAEAIDKERPIAEFDMTSDRNRWLKAIPALRDVESYVAVPIKVGDTVFGTLSMATSVRYPFTPFELQGFTSIANGVGIAIINFRNYHDMTERFGDIAVGVTALEISAAVRHATGDILDRCGHYLEEVSRAVPRSVPAGAQAIGELATELGLLSNELQKFKVATERPTREPELVDLEVAWSDAAEALGGRLANLGIRALYEGPAIQMVAYGDWIGHLFLNLILNSMDAFENMKKQRGREIRLRVTRPGPSDPHLRLIYSDNATGIMGSKLVGGARYVAELPVKQRIFEAHVTSKRDPEAGYRPQPGSGLGLFLVRKIMADHNGSVDLVESSEGAMFRILFPSRLVEDRR